MITLLHCHNHGVFILMAVQELDDRLLSMDSQVAQLYVRRPLLIDGFKFDLRVSTPTRLRLLLPQSEDGRAYGRAATVAAQCSLRWRCCACTAAAACGVRQAPGSVVVTRPHVPRPPPLPPSPLHIAAAAAAATTLQVYVLVASIRPLRVYAFRDGLARLCTSAYARPAAANMGDRCMHLTNYAINRHADAFVANADARRDDTGSKRSLR
jgi:Tubulin-tyrosine ligase family